MKRLITFLLLMASCSFGAATNTAMLYSGLMIDTNTWLISAPISNGLGRTNFMVANGMALNSQLISDTNALSIRIAANASGITAVSNRVTTLEGQTNSVGAISNRVDALEALTNSYPRLTDTTNLFISGVVSGQVFYGSGIGLTGITASVTGAISSITIGTTTNLMAQTFVGNDITTDGNGTTTWHNTEYKSWQIVPVSTTYEYVWEMPRDFTTTIVKVWGQVDNYNCTFDIVEAVSNEPWRTTTTNVTGIFATSGGIWVTNFTDSIINPGNRWGIRVTDVDPRTANLSVGVKLSW